MPQIWTINPNQPGKERLNINFDQHGNAIGPNKSKYVEFLGTIARNGKLAPLNAKDWREVSQPLKRAMVELVKVMLPTINFYYAKFLFYVTKFYICHFIL